MAYVARICLLVVSWWALSVSPARASGTEYERATELYKQTIGADVPDTSKMTEAFNLWKKLADNGDAQSMYYLSAVYFRGIPGVSARNDKEALSLLEKSAAKGLPDALFSLAWQCESGTKMKQDLKRALQLYESAGRLGHSLALSRLVRVYEHGELGESHDPKRAEYWKQRMGGCPLGSDTSADSGSRCTREH